MSKRLILAAVGVFVFSCSPVLAQAPAAEKTFNLKHTTAADTTAQAKARKANFVPRLTTGKIEATLTLGFLDLNTPFVEHSGRMIYKYTSDATYFGNVVLKGESAFNPVLRVGYGLKPWLAVEGGFSVSVSEYKSEITRTVALSNETGDNTRLENVPLGEFDGEERSCISITSGLTALVYPLDLSGDGSGRFHPYVAGGFGRSWFSLNSNYTMGSATSWTISGGGGFRYIADDVISLRVDVLYSHSRVQFTPADRFLSLNEDTLIIPIIELPEVGQPVPVTDYPSEAINALSWAIGFTAAF